MCSFELESIVKSISALDGFWKIYGVHLFQFVYNLSEFSISVSH